MPDPCCPCDATQHPPPPDIPPGLASLPRQWAGFVEYRRAMLAGIPAHPALASWRARGAGDLGVMLLEMWAYVLDVVGFYDARIADESYIRTAKLPLSAQRLVRLLGYRPKPAVSAAATLALVADGADSVVLPPGTAFRSEAFGDEPPQVFEITASTTIWPQRNTWRLAPVRGDVFAGRLLFAQGTARLAVGQVVVLSGAGIRLAARVRTLASERALDGATYVRADLDPPPTALAGTALSDIAIVALTQQASPNPVSPSPSLTAGPTASITLDRVYPQLSTGDVVVVQTAGVLMAATIAAIEIDLVAVPTVTSAAIALRRFAASAVDTSPHPAMPVTRVSLALRAAPPAGWANAFLMRFGSIDGGTPTLPAKTRIAMPDVVPTAALAGPVEPLGAAPGPAAVLAKGTEAEGPKIRGSVSVDAAGNGLLQPASDATPFAPLRTPVDLYGNLVETTRGETVANEILGSADATQAFQSFTLQKKPLTYLLDTASPDHTRAALELRVNGILWQEAPSFFDAGPTDEVYVVRRDPDQTARVIFGDGIRGARPSSGVGNVTATYRFGAGAAKPPAGTITQVARQVKGLRSVFNPLPARGGADAEGAGILRIAAPRSALTLGRAVSLDDFEALARGFPGIVNAAAAWAFDGSLQRASVKIWIIADGGDPSGDLRANLRGNADPQVPIVVTPATPVPIDLRVSLEISGRYDPATVRPAAKAALVDPQSGLLAPANVAIGRPLFRSEITARLLAVPGVLGATVMLAGALAPVAFMPGEGSYPDAAGLLVE
ncbi:baseplate J/gp47 family protein [Limobrevibacterium gyesilva]|uniref:Baseplate J/gp47 family protein n=1 Tax=Limobrevibacterium gyesilva TaxID=2991712 RepID=A0AA41YRJ8_9PROT|nr:baseplate J/gp47 family protein [Limobrevibacterium gyesilva]MCW3475298.1 baseplate J/gp47 family protein [Limobrevibacterium gyesilva]